MSTDFKVGTANFRRNRLANEKSPYLLQHAQNPVDWYPWGEEAFEKARQEDKPVFLSIGYSTCHWCHVMAHESFENPQAARLMNEAFVSIKVDREERPDIDNIYMTVCQMITGSGGWPLSIIMTPDKKPFFAATYIPRESQFGHIGMVELVPRIKGIWEKRRPEVLASAEKITSALNVSVGQSVGGRLGERIFVSAFEQLVESFDRRFGGFGRAPKFPSPHNLYFLLRYWRRTGEPQALEMVEKTLQAMRSGGIYDHIGFGFHRYSTDPQWLMPHFEKMLYDQALLAIAYVEAYQATGKEVYKRAAREIFTYVLRDMTDAGGGFYSAEDADSEGEEGKYYVWREDEIRRTLDPDEADLAIKVFNVSGEGNSGEQTTGTKIGANIFHLSRPYGEIAAELQISEAELRHRSELLRKKLYDARRMRIHPRRDDKILTDWNGLMIAALAIGGRVFDDLHYREAAERAADFILGSMVDARGRLYHRYREGQAALPATIDDYAFLIWGLLELYEAIFDIRYLKQANTLNNDLIEHFWDDQVGGFFFTADDAESLIVRQKEISDGALPSGNSVAALNLFRLARITVNSDLEAKALRIEDFAASQVRRSPQAFTGLLTALDFGLGPSYEVAIVGRPEAEDSGKMLKALNTRFIPNKVVVFKPMDHDSEEIEKLCPFTKDMISIEGNVTAYICRNFACDLPITDIGEMLRLLDFQKS